MTDDDITTMDDPQFLAERRRVREELDGLPPHQANEALTARYRKLNDDSCAAPASHGHRPARRATVNSTPATIALPADAARLLAVEVLLADPEALCNDALEGDLYILRDQLRATPKDEPASP